MRTLASLSVLFASGALFAQDGWAPPRHANRSGNNGFAMPGNWSDGRLQMIFTSADLPAGLTPGRLLNKVAYRRSQYPSLVNDTYGARTYSNSTLNIGNTATPGSGMVTTFSANVPGDSSAVFSGILSIPAAPPVGAMAEVAPETVIFPFATPKVFTGPNLFVEHLNVAPANVTILYWIDMLDNRAANLNGHNAVRGQFGCGQYGPTPTTLRAPAAAAANALGGTTAYTVAQASVNTSFLLTMGFGLDAPYGLPAPFDLAPLGAPGCPLWNTIDAIFIGTTGATGSGAVTVTWPTDPSLSGLEVGLQALVISLGFNAANLTTSNGISAFIGSRYPCTSSSVLATPSTTLTPAAANLYLGGVDITHLYWL